MAGIWLSVLLIGLLIIFTIVAIVANGVEKPAALERGTVLHIDLSGAIVDYPSTPSLEDMLAGRGAMPTPLSDIVGAIDIASSDSKIDGILLTCSGGLSAGLAQCEEIMAALRRFQDHGKWVWAYGDNYEQGEYFISSVADSVFVNPIGMVDIHGLGGTMFFLKDLLDKVGVEMQVVRVGTYKSAVEPFLLSDISEANREQTLEFLGSMWGRMKSTIADNRDLPSDSINSWADSFEFTKSTSDYLKEGLVDRTIYFRELENMLAEATGVEEAQIVTLSEYLVGRNVESQTVSGKSPTIAILYAQGDITESAEGGIASDRLVPEILDLADNEEINGLILRVNSGGGSAFASEQIWEALEEYKSKTGNPFYVSMGNMAASGGYYISCGADKIFASPLTLTGSIGIFGVIPNAEGLLKDKLGVNTVTLTTNTGNFPNFFQPMDQGQRDAMQSYVNRGYDLFLNRVAESRGLPVDSIAAVAQGRVWSGLSAYENCLVDCLGGLQDCIEAMASELGCSSDDVNIRRYPVVSRQWWEALLALNDGEIYSAVSTAIDPQSKLYNEIIRRVSTMYPIQCRTPYIYIK